MKSFCLTVTVCLALSACVFLAGADSKPDVQALLARMDKAANEFKSMTARVTYVTHTAALDEDDTETGTVIRQKVQPGEVEGLVDFVTPDPHRVRFEKRRVEIFRPKIKQLEVYDLAKYGEQVDKFVMIGYGTSGSEVAKDYDVTVLGVEALKDQPGRFTHARLVPKSEEARQYMKNLELWIPEQGEPYPVRERILEPSGDYVVVSYSDLKINPPLKSDALQLNLPAGVKTVYPGK